MLTREEQDRHQGVLNRLCQELSDRHRAEPDKPAGFSHRVGHVDQHDAMHLADLCQVFLPERYEAVAEYLEETAGTAWFVTARRRRTSVRPGA